jgi:Amt family ammonium transporter
VGGHRDRSRGGRGLLLTGVVASNALNSGIDDGLIYGGVDFLLKQVVGVVAILAFSYVASYLLARLVDSTVGLRVEERSEIEGLDITEHEERAYSVE